MSLPDEHRRPLLEITAHDPGMDRKLRRNLIALRDKSKGTEMADLLDDVLAGRKSLREVARTSAWNDAVAPAVDKMMEQWAKLSDPEKQVLAAQGREQLDVERCEAFREQQERNAR